MHRDSVECKMACCSVQAGMCYPAAVEMLLPRHHGSTAYLCNFSSD